MITGYWVQLALMYLQLPTAAIVQKFISFNFNGLFFFFFLNLCLCVCPSFIGPLCHMLTLPNQSCLLKKHGLSHLTIPSHSQNLVFAVKLSICECALPETDVVQTCQL